MQIGSFSASASRLPGRAVHPLDRAARLSNLKLERAMQFGIAGRGALVYVQRLRRRLVNQQGTALVDSGQLKLNVAPVACGLHRARRAKPKAGTPTSASTLRPHTIAFCVASSCWRCPSQGRNLCLSCSIFFQDLAGGFWLVRRYPVIIACIAPPRAQNGSVPVRNFSSRTVAR